MAYTRQYTDRVNWQNSPSLSTPLNATNLNKMDAGLSNVDSAVASEFESVEQDISDLQSAVGGAVQDVQVDGTSVVSQGVAVIPAIPTVVANPSGTGSADLTKLQVGSTVYDISSGGGGGTVYLPTLYSEEEREVGVWTDGKPLYQKTFDLSSDVSIGSNSWYDTGIAVQDIERCINIFAGQKGGVITNENNNVWGALGAVYNTSTNSIRILNCRPAAIDLRYFTMQYTKTTDTAGSGKYLPDGQYAHHYSTTEHIIGTWTDGSTLYEITFTTPALTSNAWNENNLPVANINKIVGHEILIDELQDSIPYTFSLGSADGGRYEAQFWHNRNADKYQMYVKAQGTVSNIYATITIRYTKSSS